ncbi:hypothetical protein [Pectinatus frisingensis]|uniref:hypothetical protein n=1 Tax=Pectinatus frisingensis TaxID=865 RepID=UPI0018C54AD1|nr:hypothetical protein [Pectinatus frisingensis]
MDINQRKEDYFVRATFKTKLQCIHNVLCKIYLPKNTTEKPYIKIRPTKEQYEILSRAFVASLHVKTINKCTLYAKEVYFKNPIETYWGNIAEYCIDGNIEGLYTIIPSPNNSPNTSVLFSITPNKEMPIFKIIQNFPDGSTKVETINDMEFVFKNKLKISFDKHYRFEHHNDMTCKQSHLVMTLIYNSAINNIHKFKELILPKVDNVLLLLSFITQTRTAWVQFNVTIKNYRYTYYRGNYRFPTGKSEYDHMSSIVEQRNIKNFIQHSYDILLNSPYKNSTEKAIYSLTPDSDRFIEDKFLSLFAGFEAIILDYRRNNNLENIVSEEQWPKIKKKLQFLIKKPLKEELNAEKRDFIYKKLDELNRVSLRDAYTSFCRKYNQLDTTDLWPIFACGKNIGLSQIRNKIIHGDTINLENILWIALENLRYVLERIILVLLEYDVNDTYISQKYLAKNISSIDKLPEAREKTAELFLEHKTK